MQYEIDEYLVLQELNEFLDLIKHHIGQDVLVYVKICRILSVIYSNIKNKEKKGNLYENGNKILEIIEKISDEYLVTGLIMQKCNMNMNDSLWEVLKQRSCIDRYRCYQNIIENKIYECCLLILNTNESYKEIKNWLGRISSTEIKQYQRMLGRISHNNPWIVSLELMKRVRLYNKQMNEIAVLSMTNTSQMFQDVLIFSAIKILNEKDESQIEQQNIHYFIGELAKKYHKIDLHGVFMFVVSKTNQEEYEHLGMLSELLSKMTGVKLVEILNYDQLLSQGGAIDLQAESLSLSQELRSAKKSLVSLKQYLWTTTTSYKNYTMVFTLFIVLSQKKQQIIVKYGSGNDSFAIKQIVELHDNLTMIIGQLVQFFKNHAESFAHYQQLFPDNALTTMVKDYRISIFQAIHVIRKTIKPVQMMSDQERDTLIQLISNLYDSTTHTQYIINNSNRNLVPSYIFNLPSQIWNHINKEIFFHFWIFSLENIYTPHLQYTKNILKLELFIKELEEKKQNVDYLNQLQQTDQQKQKKTFEKEIEFSQNIIKKLKQEQQSQEKKKQSVDQYLNQRKDFIFEGNQQSSDLNFFTHFIQHCIYPRLQFEQVEAIYCAQFIHLMHRFKKPNFKELIDNLNWIIDMIIPVLHCCTFKEAENIGAFISELLIPLNNFNDEKILKADLQQHLKIYSFIDFKKDQKQILILFHKIITISLIYNSNKYMQQRNFIAFLGKISQFLPVFPGSKQSATVLNNFLEKIKAKKNLMEDLKLLVQSYITNFQNKINTFIDVDIIDQNEQSQEKQQQQQQQQFNNQLQQTTSKKEKDLKTTYQNNISNGNNNNLSEQLQNNKEKKEKESKKESEIIKNQKAYDSNDLNLNNNNLEIINSDTVLKKVKREHQKQQQQQQQDDNHIVGNNNGQNTVLNEYGNKLKDQLIQQRKQQKNDGQIYSKRENSNNRDNINNNLIEREQNISQKESKEQVQIKKQEENQKKDQDQNNNRDNQYRENNTYSSNLVKEKLKERESQKEKKEKKYLDFNNDRESKHGQSSFKKKEERNKY